MDLGPRQVAEVGQEPEQGGPGRVEDHGAPAVSVARPSPVVVSGPAPVPVDLVGGVVGEAVTGDPPTPVGLVVVAAPASAVWWGR